MFNFLPEGNLIDTKENKAALSSIQALNEACAKETILEARALVCDQNHNLIVDLGGKVLDVMVKLAKESNITMVVVTHEMGFARQVADRVVFMADGQIVESGTPEHFFTDPKNERVKQFLGKILKH